MKKVDLSSRISSVPGLSFHRNLKNSFLVIELDYWSDPAKTDPSWAAEERKKYPPKQWWIALGKYTQESLFTKALFLNAFTFQQKQSPLIQITPYSVDGTLGVLKA